VYTVAERQAEDLAVNLQVLRLPAAINNAIGRDVLPHGRLDATIPAIAAFVTGVIFTMPRASALDAGP